MRITLIFAAILVAVAGCASVSQYRIEDSLEDLGLPVNKASCIGGQLRDRLDNKDLQELADFLTELARADSAGEGLDVVLEIENPAVVGAVTASAISCAFAPSAN